MKTAIVTEPKETQILFKSPMVRAILEDRKTVTRRLPSTEIGINHDEVHPYAIRDKKGRWHTYKTLAEFVERRSPYGKPGDVLWVRETFCYDEPRDLFWYKADADSEGNLFALPVKGYSPDGIGCLGEPILFKPQKWTASILMPRVACRLRLCVTDVQVERLQDISDEQCIAEGIELIGGQIDDSPVFKDYSKGAANDVANGDGYGYPRNSFESLWDSINQGRGYGWDTNPYVWTVEFERIIEE